MSDVKGRVIARREWSEGLWSLVLDARIEPHEPGQFLNIGLRLDRQVVRRAYSLASPPGAPPEFYLVRVAGGALTPALYDLALGDEIEIDPHPQGFFVVSEVPAARDLWLVCTGTGLGPYLAMLRHGEVLRRFESVTLVHGVRGVRELGYRDELEALARADVRFRYLAVLSRESVDGMVHGRITAALDGGELERAAGRTLAPDSSQVMLCGNPAMIADMMARLGQRGLEKHRRRKPGHITVEKYW